MLSIAIKLDLSLSQCDVLVLRAGQHGQVPAEDVRDDHHGAAAHADDRRVRGQHLGAQLHGDRAASHVRHQQNQHQTLHGHVLLILNTVRAVLLQGVPSPQTDEEGEERQNGADRHTVETERIHHQQ